MIECFGSFDYPSLIDDERRFLVIFFLLSESGRIKLLLNMLFFYLIKDLLIYTYRCEKIIGLIFKKINPNSKISSNKGYSTNNRTSSKRLDPKCHSCSQLTTWTTFDPFLSVKSNLGGKASSDYRNNSIKRRITSLSSTIQTPLWLYLCTEAHQGQQTICRKITYRTETVSKSTSIC